MNIKDRIYKAIGEFVESHTYKQEAIYLSSADYKELHTEAASTELGRSFLIGDYGNDMNFCDLSVHIHPDDRKDIVIC